MLLIKKLIVSFALGCAVVIPLNSMNMTEESNQNSIFKPIKINSLNWYSENDIPKEIPLLDLKNMSKEEKINCIKKAAEKAQCLYVKNHNIDEKDIEDLINITRIFFNEPDSVKSQFSRSGYGKMRGYHGYRQQSTSRVFGVSNAGKGDSHISFSMGTSDNFYPNINKFEELWTKCFNGYYELAKTISELIIESLEIEDTLSWNNLKDGDNLLKIQEFVAGDEESSAPYRIVPHADTSFITLLNQFPADNGYIGLEALIGDKFVGIPAVKDTILINFGEPMYSLSKERLKPVIHQVVSPKENFAGSSRLSIPFFFHPNPETIIYPSENSTYKKYYNSEGATSFGDFSRNVLSGS